MSNLLRMLVGGLNLVCLRCYCIPCHQTPECVVTPLLNPNP